MGLTGLSPGRTCAWGSKAGGPRGQGMELEVTGWVHAGHSLGLPSCAGDVCD